jgi:hypothetical protein
MEGSASGSGIVQRGTDGLRSVDERGSACSGSGVGRKGEGGEEGKTLTNCGDGAVEQDRPVEGKFGLHGCKLYILLIAKPCWYHHGTATRDVHYKYCEPKPWQASWRHRMLDSSMIPTQVDAQVSSALSNLRQELPTK